MMNTRQKNICMGLLAHVDAGKTTLSEAILHTAGVLRKTGRIESGDTALDTHEIERARGITVFSAEAHFTFEGQAFTLLDTPGHVDFSAEMERALSVLDAAVLVISGTDGVQAHTRTLWRLLALYRTPVVFFVTKMDYARRTEEELMRELTAEFGDDCVSFSPSNQERDEQLATADETVLQHYLDSGRINDEEIAGLVGTRKLFPVLFGSGMTEEGVPELLRTLSRYISLPDYGEHFGARVYKISHDAKGVRLVHMKLTGGSLAVKDAVGEEKINQIRSYTGEKYELPERVYAGDICAVTGLTAVQAGDGLGFEESEREMVLEPVMSYAIHLPEGKDAAEVLPKLMLLAEEDPKLHITKNSFTGEIRVGLMGEVQAEILKSLIEERFRLSVELGRGQVLYRETVENTVEGVGHYEPLRHYAEVHLLIEPLPRGSGILLDTDCAPNSLDKNWQNLVLQHLSEKTHLGVLTGSPLTDVKITLVSGRAHLKHTEGGDFRQATYRALRQGLMLARSRLLEPYYRFRIELPAEVMSRAVNDIQRKSGYFAPPVYNGDNSVLSGRAPVSELSDYAKELSAYSGGRGRIELLPDGYDLCHNEEEVVHAAHYIPEADLDNSPDSIFCAHGAGFLVPWDKVRLYMHLPLRGMEKQEVLKPMTAPVVSSVRVSDRELEDLMMKEFGPIRRAQYGKPSGVQSAVSREKKGDFTDDYSRIRPEVLVVDGYNVIFDWQELRELARSDIQAAREALQHVLSNYTAFVRCDTTLVYDGYRIPGNPGESISYPNIRVVYTKERESADLYIERFLKTVPRGERAAVVTSDSLIQLQALGSGVLRISSAGFLQEVRDVNIKIEELLERNRSRSRTKIGDIADLPVIPERLKEKEDEE